MLLPGDFDQLAVHGNDPGARGDLAGGRGEQVALPQSGVGRDVGQQLIQFTSPARGKGQADPRKTGPSLATSHNCRHLWPSKASL